MFSVMFLHVTHSWKVTANQPDLTWQSAWSSSAHAGYAALFEAQWQTLGSCGQKRPPHQPVSA